MNRANRVFRSGPGVVALGLLAFGLAGTRPVEAQTASQPVAADPPISLEGLADRPASTLRMKLEKTFLKVDVLFLTLRVDSASAASLAAEVEAAGKDGLDDAAYDRVAENVVEAHEVIARIEFLRGVSLDQFLGGVDDDMQKAVRAGWLDRSGYQSIRDSLPVWFALLDERGIEEGDQILYHVRGDTLRTVFVGVTGDVLLDQTDVGRANRMSLLGAYMAPGSSFRKKLIESLEP